MVDFRITGCLFFLYSSTNPHAFPEGNPNRMLANKRLWLPNAVKPPNDSTRPSGYTIESFQWGSIKKGTNNKMRGLNIRQKNALWRYQVSLLAMAGDWVSMSRPLLSMNCFTPLR